MNFPPNRRRTLYYLAATLAVLSTGWLAWRFLDSKTPPRGGEPSDPVAANLATPAPAPAPPPPPAQRYRVDLPLAEVATRNVALESDRAGLLRDAAAYSERTGVYRFAAPIDVRIDPGNSGTWDRTSEGNLRWRLLLHSPEALSLNFGFTTFAMPAGGALRISLPGTASPYRDFTDADNETHGQLWTPPLEGDTVLLEVELPPGAAPASLDLELTRVNHGLRKWRYAADTLKIGGDTSGECHVDVVCTAGEAGTLLIDTYRDQIRSVASYSIGGSDLCTGTAINNTAQDGTPYFLTADHCGIDAGNAPSVIAYWNFENTTCRLPDTPASGGVGNGDITQFNTGAIFRAAHGPSDFTLVEFDDPIDPAHAVYYAGWSRSTAEATMTACVHHPNNAEKRISFDFDPTVTTLYLSSIPNPSASHLRVGDWDIGSTEGGSSGSSLFDQNGRIIGVLTGGNASCGVHRADWYGRISLGWTGAGTSETRLSDWLDPGATGAVTQDGADFAELVSVDDIAVAEGNSGTSLAQFTVSLNASLPVASSVIYATQDDSATDPSDYLAAGGTVNFAAFETSKTVSVTVNGDATPEEHETFKIVLSSPVNVNIGDGEGVCQITNDDYIVPVITSSLSENGTVGVPFNYAITADNTPTTYALSGAIPAGMTIDNPTGVVSWTPTLSGVYTPGITADNPAGGDAETLTITVAEHPVLTGIEQDGSGRVVTDGPIPWTLVASPAHDGTDAARSGTVVDGGSTWFETTVTGPDTVLFEWKVDSEEHYDFLTLSLDGAPVRRISGDVDWTRQALAIPAGEHVVRWEYAKDAEISSGLDRAWVDELVFASDFTYPLVASDFAPCRVVGGVILYDVHTSIPADTITVTGLPPAGLVADADGVVRENGSAAPGTYPLTVTVTNAFGSDVQVVNLELLPAAGLAAALDIDSLDLAAGSTTGDAWFAQSSTTHDGIDAVQSADIKDDEFTEFKITVVGPGTVSFWWSVSSEEDFDYLEFLVDGFLVGDISGLQAWQQFVHPLAAGVHELTWRYIKDGAVNENDDTGWVDEIALTGYAGWIAGEGVGGRAALHIDAEYDAFTNLEDYYYDQGAATTEPHDVPSFSTAGGNRRITIPKRASATDVTATVEVSTNLLNWSTANTSVVSDTPTELIVEETFVTKPPAIYFRVNLLPY